MEDQHEADEEVNFRYLLENAPDALVLVTESGEIQYVNAQAERLFGYTTEELIGKDVEVLVPERYREVHKTHRAAYAQAPRLRSMLPHLAGLRKDGSEFLAEINLSPMPGGLTVAAIREREDWQDSASEREREREHERAQAREREREREHERAQGRARARNLKSISIPTAIVIVVVAQIAFNFVLYWFLGRP